MSKIEQRARAHWIAWANYAKFTRCDDCEQMRYCRARRTSGPWLCIECFDQR